MEEVPLTQGYCALVDDDDYGRAMEHNWQAVVKPQTVYGKRMQGKITVQLHRFILGVTDPNIEVDHIDHNGLNCQKNNLRVTAKVANGNRYNRRKVDSTASSQYKGVYKHGNKWHACIQHDHKRTHLGSYESEITAAQAYDAAAISMFKDFACLNFAR